MMITPQKAIHYERYEFKKWKPFDAETIVESPVSLTVNGQVWLTFMCTPVDLEALSVGFLYNEGIIESMEEVEDVRVCEHGDNVDVWLNHSVEQPQSWRRTSGCTGGVTAVDALARVDAADSFILALPLSADASAVAVAVFLGGFSAATAMIVVDSLALSKMISNDIVLPFLLRRRRFEDVYWASLASTRVGILVVVGLGLVWARIEAGQFLLDRRARRHARGSALGWQTLGRRKRFAIDLAVGSDRQAPESHEGRRYHEVGKQLLQEGPQPLRTRLLPAARRDVR